MLYRNKKYNIINAIDKIIFFCLILYTFTFLLDIKINFLTTAAAFGLIKLIYIRPQIEIKSKFFYLVLVFFIGTFLSIIFNDVSALSGENLTAYKSRFFSPLIGLLLIFLFRFTKKHILILLSGMSCSLLLNAVYIIYQFSQGMTGRLVGFASNYMLLCAMNILILPIIFSLALYKFDISNKLKLLFALTILVNIPAVILENTRIVWIALSIVYLIIILISFKKKRNSFILIILIVICGGIFFYNSPQSINRLSSITNISYQNQSNYERLLMWQSAGKMFIEHPVFGVGVGNYHEQYMKHYRSAYSREEQWHPHNVLLAMLSETGIVGGISYLLLFVYLYYNVINTYKNKKNIASFAYLMCLIAYSINCLTDSMFCGHNIKSPTTLFWLFTGFYLVLNKYVIIFFDKRI